jgi:type I restriction enzyme S subunit
VNGALERLGDLAAFVRGITFKPDDVVPVGTPGSVACMRTKNVQTILDLSDVWGIPEPFVKAPAKYLRPGDILVSSANSWNLVGKCCWIPALPWPATFGGFVSVLRATSERLDSRYLFHWFSSPRTQAVVRSYGRQTTNIANLNIERCLSMAIPLPPLFEQQRLADILDRVEALRAKRLSALANLESLKQALFLDLFGDPLTNPKEWPRRPFAELCERVTVGIVVRPASYYVPTGVPALRSLNIRPGEIVLDDLVFVSEEDNETRLAKTRFKAGDLAIVRSGQPGTAAIIPPELDRMQAVDLLMVTPRPQTADARFLCQFLNAAGGRALVLARQRGQVQKHLNVGALNEAMIPIPPIAMQSEFSRRVQQVENVRAAQRVSLSELHRLADSLQHRAFRGEL